MSSEGPKYHLEPRFFFDGEFQEGGTIQLVESDARHALQVLRLKVDDAIELFNGRGAVAKANIRKTGRASLDAEVLSIGRTENHNHVRVAFSISKPSALESMLRHCTELGVESFQPVVSRYSHRMEWREDRWNRIIVEAMKQSQEDWMPKLHAPVALSSWLSELGKVTGSTFFYCSEFDRLAEPGALTRSASVTILVGSEGGWTQEEIALFESSGARSMGLGKNRLRAETAALAALVRTKELLREFGRAQ